MIGQTLVPETTPVVGGDLVKPIYYIVESVSFDLGRAALSAVKEVAEIVHRFFALRLLTNDRIYPQPIQDIFVVIIQRTAPGFPLAWRPLHRGHTVSRVLQIAPDTA